MRVDSWRSVPSASDMSVIGAEFEEEGTQWVVHDVRYEELTGKDGKDASCIIVLYYQAGDSEAADDEDCTNARGPQGKTLQSYVHKGSDGHGVL